MIYTLIGEEALLIRRSLEKLLKDRVPAEGREFNFHAYEGSGLQAQEVIQTAQTFPVFAPRRVILIKNFHEVKKSELDRLEPFLEKIPETTDLIIVSEKSDRRLTFWQTLFRVSKSREFKPLSEQEAPRWLAQEASAEGYQLASGVAEWIVSAIGTDLNQLHAALEKLILLKGNQKTISLSDVESCIASFNWKNIFQLTDAVGERKLAKALKLFHHMQSSGESPIAMIALLARHFRILAKIKEGDSAGIPPYFVKDYQRQANCFRPGEIEDKREKIFQTDWALKSSPLDNHLLFERLLMDLCR